MFANTLKKLWFRLYGWIIFYSFHFFSIFNLTYKEKGTDIKRKKKPRISDVKVGILIKLHVIQLVWISFAHPIETNPNGCNTPLTMIFRFIQKFCCFVQICIIFSYRSKFYYSSGNKNKLLPISSIRKCLWCLKLRFIHN